MPTQLSVKHLVQDYNKENTKALHYLPFGEGWKWITLYAIFQKYFFFQIYQFYMVEDHKEPVIWKW